MVRARPHRTVVVVLLLGSTNFIRNPFLNLYLYAPTYLDKRIAISSFLSSYHLKEITILHICIHMQPFTVNSRDFGMNNYSNSGSIRTYARNSSSLSLWRKRPRASYLWAGSNRKSEQFSVHLHLCKVCISVYLVCGIIRIKGISVFANDCVIDINF